MSDSRTGVLIGATWPVTILAAVACAMRLYARRIKRLPLGADDWMAVAGLVLAFGCCICSTICGQFGIGRHIETVSAKEQELFFKTLFGYNQIYIATGPVIKLAVLLMYQRVFDIAPFRLAARVLGAAVVIWWLGEALTGILTCIPVYAYWDLPLQAEPTTKCIDLKIYDIQYAVINIAFDLIILALPVRMILKLQLTSAQKAGFVIIFLLGGFTAVAALIRLLTAILNLSDPDYTYAYTDALIWTSVEPAVGVMSACLPLLRPVLLVVLPKGFRLSSPSRGTSKPRSTPSNGFSRHFSTAFRRGSSTQGLARLRDDDSEAMPAEDVQLRNFNRLTKSESAAVKTSLTDTGVSFDGMVTPADDAPHAR